MTHVTCRLTAKNGDQLQSPTLGNRVWATFLDVWNEPANVFTHTHTHTVRRAHTTLMCHVYAILAMQPATARCWWWRGRVLIATTPPPPTGCARMIVLHAHIKRGIFFVLRARKSCVHMELPAHRALCRLSVCLSCILCVFVCVNAFAVFIPDTSFGHLGESPPKSSLKRSSKVPRSSLEMFARYIVSASEVTTLWRCPNSEKCVYYYYYYRS